KTPGYFSWKLIDLRKSVLTDDGYRSTYKYSRGDDMNNNYEDYHDYFVKQSSADQLVLESFEPLKQENWKYYRSQGKSQIAILLKDGAVADAKLIILKNYNKWLENKEPNDLNIEVPLTCVHSFKPLSASN